MNWQIRADERSKALHREIAKKLRSNPSLWEIPKKNLGGEIKKGTSFHSITYYF